MFGKRGLSCALWVGLGVSFTGCAQPTVYSGAYLSRYGPVYGGLYYYGGSNYWPYYTGPYFTGPTTPGPYYRGSYHGGYYWPNGYPYRHGVYYRGGY